MKKEPWHIVKDISVYHAITFIGLLGGGIFFIADLSHGIEVNKLTIDTKYVSVQIELKHLRSSIENIEEKMDKNQDILIKLLTKGD